MQRNVKLAIAMAILVAGVSAALLFRRDASATADSGTPPTEALPYRSVDNAPVEPTAVTLPEEPAAPVATGRAVAPWSTPRAGNLITGPAPAKDPIPAVPSLPPQYGPAESAPAPAIPPPPPATAPAAASLPPPPSGISPAAAPYVARSGASVSLMPPLRTHRVADGDTLGQIATDYLGEATRQEEILELNREVLSAGPDLLPIGAVLKIPPSAAPTTEGIASHPRAEGSSDLVPIPPGALHP